MKQKIKIKYFNPNCGIKQFAKGDWIDCRSNGLQVFSGPMEYSAEDEIFENKIFGLGFAMQLPKGYEAILAPRSSTFQKFGLVFTNSIGVIDNTYCGDNDEWKFAGLAFRSGKIENGERVCQFKIQLSQYATVWQKIKWLFTSGFEFEIVDHLSEKNRGGFGTTGK